jgi:hypothetical protein
MIETISLAARQPQGALHAAPTLDCGVFPVSPEKDLSP